jgi:hypothetical protein
MVEKGEGLRSRAFRQSLWLGGRTGFVYGFEMWWV